MHALPASTATRRDWLSHQVTVARARFPAEAPSRLHARRAPLACFAIVLGYRRRLGAAMQARTMR